jgi:CubicO group peptidase (beta-lactamase class C family)
MKRFLPLALLLAPGYSLLGSALKMLLFEALFLCAATSLTQVPLAPLDPKHLAAIDDFINREMARQRIPGLELGIYSRGHILLAKGYGLANVELNVPVKPETIMQSGSVGKQFVAAAIMMLVEEGKLSLDDSIAKYFPDAPAAWKPVLIKNLLSHTSGLSEYESPDRTGPNGPFYFRLDFTEEELAKKIEALPIEWAPGEKWDYRNTNYVLLGIIIHKITGMPYAEFLTQRIFKPLGMTSTRLISDRDIIPNRAAGYEIDSNGERKNQEWVSPTFNSTADGTLYFNVLDLAKWDEALYGTKLLQQSSLDRIWTVYPLNNGKPNPADYGFGWMIGAQDGHKRIEHGGAWQGFTCRISRYPDDSLTVVVLTNLEAGYSNPGVIAHVVAGLVNPALTVPKLEAVADDRPELAGRVKKLLDEIVAGKDIRPETTPQLAAAITPDMLKRSQQSLAKLWPGGTLTLVKRQKGAEGEPQWVSTYRVSKGGDAMLLVFGLAADGKIVILHLSQNREYQ